MQPVDLHQNRLSHQIRFFASAVLENDPPVMNNCAHSILICPYWSMTCTCGSYQYSRSNPYYIIPVEDHLAWGHTAGNSCMSLTPTTHKEVNLFKLGAQKHSPPHMNRHPSSQNGDKININLRGIVANCFCDALSCFE